MDMTLEDKTNLKILAGSLLAGGALTSLVHLLNRETREPDKTNSKTIYVPLSYMNLTRPLREKHESKKKAPRETVPLLPAPEEVSAALAASGADSLEGLSDKDMASLKRRLLKGASDCSKECAKECAKECKPDTDVAHNNSLKEEAEIADHAEVKHVNAPVFEEAVIGHTDGPPRDTSGRFVAKPFSDKQEKQEKKAFSFIGDPVDDTERVTRYILSGTLGVLGGAFATKAIIDHIKQKRATEALEAARHRYADAITKELSDEDLPYYTALKAKSNRRTVKAASADEEVGVPGAILGSTFGLGLLGGGLAAAITYKILSNRVNEEEAKLTKNLGADTPTIMYTVSKGRKTPPVK